MKTLTFISNLKSDVSALMQKSEAVLNGMTLRELNSKGQQAQWSVLECIAHVNLYNRFYIPEIEKAISNCKTSGPQESVRHTWIGNFSIKMMDPSNQKRQKTFKRMNPSSSALKIDVVEEFMNQQDKLLQLLDKAQQTDINASNVRVEFFKLLKMKIGESLQFVIVHEQRHILQAERMKATLLETSPILIL